MDMLTLIPSSTTGVALHELLYPLSNLIKSSCGREVRKTFARVKSGMSVTLVRANLKLPY